MVRLVGQISQCLQYVIQSCHCFKQTCRWLMMLAGDDIDRVLVVCWGGVDEENYFVCLVS